MKKRKQDYVPFTINDVITFNGLQQLEWLWDHEMFNSETTTLALTLVGSEDERPEKLDFQFTYLDVSKQPLPIEYIDRMIVELPIRSQKTKYVKEILLNRKIGNKLLWKVGIKPVTKKKRTFIIFTLT
jgi:hypothetical protein